MKNIFLLIILILITGALIYLSKNDPANDNLTQSTRRTFTFLRLPSNNNIEYNQNGEINGEKSEETAQNIINNNETEKTKNLQPHPLTPPSAAINKPISFNIYLNQTQKNEEIKKVEVGKNFQNWREAIEKQGFDFNNTQDMESLKKIRLEFFTLQEIKNKKDTEDLIQYIEDVKNQLKQNNALIIDDNILLGDLLEITYKNNLEENSPLLLKKFIESFYIIPLKKEIEIANSAQTDTENTYYSFFYTILNNSFFAPIGSTLESHTSSEELPPQEGIDCGGGTEVSDYPPGHSFYASSCNSCDKKSKSCRKLCGACGSSIGYLWDSITGICGCGA
mgnify:FL=1